MVLRFNDGIIKFLGGIKLDSNYTNEFGVNVNLFWMNHLTTTSMSRLH